MDVQSYVMFGWSLIEVSVLGRHLFGQVSMKSFEPLLICIFHTEHCILLITHNTQQLPPRKFHILHTLPFTHKALYTETPHNK